LSVNTGGDEAAAGNYKENQSFHSRVEAGSWD
jgi:hypothetical protein